PGRVGTALGMRASVADHSSMQRELFGLVDAFVVLNETARRMLMSNGSPASKLMINRLGLSQIGYECKPDALSAPTASPVRVGYGGRLHPSKGLHAIVRAARRVPADVPFTLEIRGPATTAAAQALVGELRQACDGDGRVRFAPGVAPADVP